MSIVIVGAGPNLGMAIARRFGREGLAVGLISCTQPRLEPARAGVGISFAAEVAYARMLHDQLAADGVHVAHTAIAGRIAPGQDHEPDDIAEALWSHHTLRDGFQTRIGID